MTGVIIPLVRAGSLGSPVLLGPTLFFRSADLLTRLFELEISKVKPVEPLGRIPVIAIKGTSGTQTGNQRATPPSTARSSVGVSVSRAVAFRR
jgi:hypothetical protein